MRYRQPSQNKQPNDASGLFQQLQQRQKQKMVETLALDVASASGSASGSASASGDTDDLLKLKQMTNMKVFLNINITTPRVPCIPISTIAQHTFATIQPKISSGDYIKNKKMNAIFNNKTFLSCFVNSDNQKVLTKPILTQEEYVLYKDRISNCQINPCDPNYKAYSNGSLISNLYTYQDLSGVNVLEATSSSTSSSNLYDNYIIDPDEVLFGTQSTSTLFEYQQCKHKHNNTFTTQIPNTPQLVNFTASVSGNCNDVTVELHWFVISLPMYVIEYDVYKNDDLYATVKNTTYTFVGLSCGTPDTFKVVAHNNCGSSSLPVEITPEYPPSTPAFTDTITYDYEVDGPDTVSITVYWTASEYPGNSDDSVSYHIYYDNLSPIEVDYTTLSYTFYELEVNTSYTFTLYATNTIGASCTDTQDVTVDQRFTFTYRTTDLQIDETTVLAKLPFITSGGDLVFDTTKIIVFITTITENTTTIKQVVVIIPHEAYTFTDNGTTTDGLCFNATTAIHDYYFSGDVISITVNWFSDIPI